MAGAASFIKCKFYNLCPSQRAMVDRLALVGMQEFSLVADLGGRKRLPHDSQKLTMP